MDCVPSKAKKKEGKNDKTFLSSRSDIVLEVMAYTYKPNTWRLRQKG